MATKFLTVLTLLFLGLSACEKAELILTGSLEVTVTNSNGAPVAGANVHIESLSRTGTTDSLGRARFIDIPTDRYAVVISHFYHESVDLVITVTDHPVARAVVALPSDPNIPSLHFNHPNLDLPSRLIAGDPLLLNVYANNEARSPLTYTLYSSIQGVVAGGPVEDRIYTEVQGLNIGIHAMTLTVTAESGHQTTNAFSVEVEPVPPAPVLLSAVLTNQGVALTWTATSSFAFRSYTVKRASREGDYPGSIEFYHNPQDTTYLDTDLSFGSDAVYSVVLNLYNDTELTSNTVGIKSSVDRLDLDQPIRELLMDDHRSRLYVTSWGTSDVKVFDSRRMTRIGTIQLPGAPQIMEQSPDGKEVFVGMEGQGTIAVIDPDRLDLVRSLPVYAADPGPDAVTYPIEIAALTGGNIVYTGYGELAGKLVLADTRTGETVAVIDEYPFTVADLVHPPGGDLLYAITDYHVRQFSVTADGLVLVQEMLHGFSSPIRGFVPEDNRYVIVGSEKHDSRDLKRLVSTFDTGLLDLSADGRVGIGNYAIIDAEVDNLIRPFAGIAMLGALNEAAGTSFFVLMDKPTQIFRLPTVPE
ncbi:carboxypeptidase family protein [Neolewinella xylanilytica]|uniref:Carboxypeptidase family protein n=1 Tax=Neolewinella xylanilytica TaxID=1514080 RepID=A0A2S6I665_9BACT|nr:carboxypeptidase regulatory-like domain-containing protein [Neolewinella xylanilytica]PPK86647.1 carboxypeptidase family protein [Neolewinella xylanilytica]